MKELLYLLESLHPMSDSLKAHLADVVKEKFLAKKDFLLKAGHVSRRVCFIAEGMLRCFYRQDNHEICSWFMKEGDVIISVASFFSQKASYESIQALEDCHIYYITYDELQYIYRHYPEFNFIGRVLLEKYYMLSEQRLYAMRMQTATERYHHLLQQFPDIVQRVSTTDIASYLGVSRETLSRTRNKAAKRIL